MESVKEIYTHLKNREDELRNAKDRMIKIVGCSSGGFVPEELIYAAGGIPLRLAYGGEDQPIEASLPYAYRWMCPFIRAQMGYKVMKEAPPYYRLIDMFISEVSCQHQRRLGDLFQFFTDLPVFKLGIPHRPDTDYALQYYIESLKSLKQRLEKLTGNVITDDKLKNAVILYNRMRCLLRDISLLRKVQPPVIGGRDFLELNHASFVADPLFMADALHSVHQELKKKMDEVSNQKPARILLTGPALAVGDYKVFELIKEYGGEVVAEEVCEGVRHYWQKVEEKGDNLLHAIGRRYLAARTPCAFQMPSIRLRLDYMAYLAEEFQVDGIIWYQLKNCETYNAEILYANKRFKKAGMPFLKLETDYNPEEKEELRTPVETFIEGIKRR